MLNKIKKNVLLAPYTTYKIGGVADYFVEANNKAELILAVKFARENNLPLFVLGCGANILVSEKGFRGLVLHNISSGVVVENSVVVADSGV